MKVLIDTNVLIDFIAMRKPHYAHALHIIDACDKNLIYGCMAAHSIPNIYYILRKEFSVQDRREILKLLCEILSVEALDISKIAEALNDENFSDFEDCLQEQCAIAFNADYIITRNDRDFSSGIVPVIRPETFCSLFLDKEG